LTGKTGDRTGQKYHAFPILGGTDPGTVILKQDDRVVYPVKEIKHRPNPMAMGTATEKRDGLSMTIHLLPVREL